MAARESSEAAQEPRAVAQARSRKRTESDDKPRLEPGKDGAGNWRVYATLAGAG